MLRNGEVEMQARDEEIRFLRMQLAEDKRTLSLMQRSMPSKRALEQDVVTLQIQVVITASSLRFFSFSLLTR